MQTRIYYFTGTGNCLDVARDLAKKLGEAPPVSLTAFRKAETVKPEAAKVGIVFPVYDWNVPPVVEDFIGKLDLSGVQYIFAIATCNYLTGTALDRVAALCREKGGELAAGFVIRMPGNYLPFYGANDLRTQKRKFRKKDRALARIATIVDAGQTAGIEYKGIFLDRIFAAKFRRSREEVHETDRSFHADQKCNGCGICQRVCAFENIHLTDGKPEWQHRCEQCFACIHLCPRAAIQYGDKTATKKRYQNPHVKLQDLLHGAQHNQETLT